MAPNPTKTYSGIYEQYLVEPTRKITKAWYDAWTQLVSNSNSSLVSGVNGSIQYNDNGVQAGDANLTWDKNIRQERIGAETASALRASTSGGGDISMTPSDATFNDLYEGAHQESSGNVIPDGSTAADFYSHDDPSFASGQRGGGVEVQYGQTPGTPIPFSNGLGVFVAAPTDTSGFHPPASVHAYEYGGLGSGAVPGMAIGADRNTSGTGAASTIFGQLKDGRFFVFWVDDTGAPRYNVGATLASLRPTESGSVSDLSGNLFVPLDSAGVTIGDGVNVIGTGTAGMIYIPWSGTIIANTLLSTDAAVTSGSIVIDIWKVAYGSFPPTVANTITAAAKPTLSSATHSQDTTLVGWTTAIAAGDVLAYHVDSASTVKRVTLSLTVRH